MKNIRQAAMCLTISLSILPISAQLPELPITKAWNFEAQIRELMVDPKTDAWKVKICQNILAEAEQRRIDGRRFSKYVLITFGIVACGICLYTLYKRNYETKHNLSD